MFDTLKGVAARHDELEHRLSDPSIFQDRAVYERISREHAELAKIITVYRRYGQVETDIRDSNELLNDADPEIKQMAREELERLTALRGRLEDELKRLLVPTDPNDDKNVILEIRAGTGGDEAGLFAADLFRMYARYAETAGWQVEILDQHATGVGGFKEIVAVINGRGAFSRLKFESGTHRVQRVPATETQGRVHTSAVTVAVLPEAEEVDVQIDPGEIKVDVYRSTGPGGQSVNTTDSAVRLTHLPTGLVVTCQDEKSQIKNKAKALKVLRARLLDAMEREQNAQRSQQRKDQIGSGDRSERIRTYNYPQGRVTDHRIGVTLYRLEAVLQGELDAIVDPLTTHHQAQMLQHAENHSQRPVAVDHP